MVETNDPLPQRPPSKPTDIEKAIGEIIAANLVEDGATIQMGESSFRSYDNNII